MDGPLTSKLLDGRYRIGERLGAGGLAEVYAAEDVQLGRSVAIKVMRNRDDPVAAERLFRDARAAARTAHPAIVTVHAYGVDPGSGRNYLVMERLLGEDLQARMAREGRLSVRLSCKVGVEVADGLASVHESGTIHRDLKPTNIFLGRRGMHVDEVRLLDFGVSKHFDLWTLTGPGEVLGTCGYMAPEQLLDQPVDGRSDLYALGAILFECLSGQRAFTGESLAALAYATVTTTPAPLAQRCPDLPPRLCAVVDRCLAKQPDHRYPTAAALRDALIQATG